MNNKEILPHTILRPFISTAPCTFLLGFNYIELEAYIIIMKVFFMRNVKYWNDNKYTNIFVFLYKIKHDSMSLLEQ